MLDKPLEALGRWALYPKHFIVLFFLALIPLFSSLGLIYVKSVATESLKKKLELLENQAASTLSQRKAKASFLAYHKHDDNDFLNHLLLPLTFCNKEQQLFSKCKEHPAIEFSPEILQREGFLKKMNPSLSFIDEEIESTPSLREVISTLNHPVEMEPAEISLLLQLLEKDTRKNKPQILITDLSLHHQSKELFPSSQSFSLNLSLLSRSLIKNH